MSSGVSSQMSAAAVNTTLGQVWTLALKNAGVIEGPVVVEKTVAVLKARIENEAKQTKPKTTVYVKSAELKWDTLVSNPSTWIHTPTLELVIAKMKADGIRVVVYGDGDGNADGLMLEPHNNL
jgi:hypothetical protein